MIFNLYIMNMDFALKELQKKLNHIFDDVDDKPDTVTGIFPIRIGKEVWYDVSVYNNETGEYDSEYVNDLNGKI